MILPLASLVLAVSPGDWVLPQGLEAGHNGGFKEQLVAPRHPEGKKPHIVMLLMDDYGWANAGWHRNYTAPGGEFVPYTDEVQTPVMDQLVKDGINLDRQYVYKFCSPTRSALQSGRNPYHVNNVNPAPNLYNPADPVSGFSAIPRNMTGIATKMAAAGYKTHGFGKWDAGMATLDHTPKGRGYMTSMIYFHHANDYWTSKCGTCQGPDDQTATGGAGQYQPVDLWKVLAEDSLDNEYVEGPAQGYNNICGNASTNDGSNTPGGHPDSCTPGPKGDHSWFDGYEDEIFEHQVLNAVEQHDPQDKLFLFWAPHIVHAPLEVPSDFYLKFRMAEPTDKPAHERQLYHAMVNFADTAIGNLTDLLKSKNMWEDTVVVFSADNGGPIYNNGSAGANNYPLKGGKMNNWEGGIRVNSWVSGGFLPLSVRGTMYEGLVTGWDWYATFCGFAGVDPTDHRAAVAQLPAIDSYDHSPMILGLNATSPRTEIPIGSDPVATNMSSAPLCIDSIRKGYNLTSWDPLEPASATPPVPTNGRCTTVNGLIVDEGANGIWKLLIGNVAQDVYTGPHYPNISTNEVSANFIGHCGDGASAVGSCLYNIKADPLESNNLAAQMPEKAQELYDKLVKYESTAFNPDRGNVSALACEIAQEKYGNFWGPFVFP